MSRISFTSHPFLLGFEQLDQLVERTAKSGSDGYPPYNIEQRGEDAYRITLAVAGFAEADLAITLEDGQLIVRGRQAEEDDGRVFLHRGIAARQFQRSFVLAERVEVAEAQTGPRAAADRPRPTQARGQRADDQDRRGRPARRQVEAVEQ